MKYYWEKEAIPRQEMYEFNFFSKGFLKAIELVFIHKHVELKWSYAECDLAWTTLHPLSVYRYIHIYMVKIEAF